MEIVQFLLSFWLVQQRKKKLWGWVFYTNLLGNYIIGSELSLEKKLESNRKRILM